jgi:hypothetical protein
MKRWSIAVAVLALFVVAIPAASAQSDFRPDQLINTSYTNNNYMSYNQGNLEFSFWFKTYENPLNPLDDSDLTLRLQVRIDEAQGHSHGHIGKSSNVPLVNSTVTGGTCSAYYTSGPYDSQLPDNAEQFTSFERRYDKCQGIHRYSVDSSTTLTLPANSIWNLNPGTHSFDGGAVTKTISADRRVMTVRIRDYEPQKVYHAKQWTADPAAGGELVSEEWAILGTKIARRETADTINTRTNVPCQDGNPGGPWCAEVRWRTLESQFEGAGPDDLDNFMQQRGASLEDPNIDQIAELLDPAALADAGRAPVATGPLGNVLGSWQVPPPGHGSTYEAYEVSSQVPFSSGSYDQATGEFGDGVGFTTMTLRVWVDAATRMPIRQTLTRDGTTTSDYWTYDPAVARPSDYPSDFFLVAPPAQTALSQSVQYRGDEPPGQVHDQQTETTFAPYTLGDRQTVAGRELCLITTLTFRQSERMQDDVATPADHDLSSLTRVDALYAPRPKSGTCRRGTGAIEDAVLTVASVARNSGVAAAYRDSILPRAQALTAPPTPPAGLEFGDFPLFERAQNSAYTAPTDDGGRLALAEIGGTTVLVNGSFAAGDAANLLRDLEGR